MVVALACMVMALACILNLFLDCGWSLELSRIFSWNGIVSSRAQCGTIVDKENGCFSLATLGVGVLYCKRFLTINMNLSKLN